MSTVDNLRTYGNIPQKLLGFWTFSIIRCFWEYNTTFRKLDLFPKRHVFTPKNIGRWKKYKTQ
jgi:hypothetical protein